MSSFHGFCTRNPYSICVLSDSCAWYHGVERNISKCIGWNQLWRYLGEYWNKLNFTCLICSWCPSWSLVANPSKWLEIAARDQEGHQLQMSSRQVKFNLFQYSPWYHQSWFQPIRLFIFRLTPWYHRKPIKHIYRVWVWNSNDSFEQLCFATFSRRS